MADSPSSPSTPSSMIDSGPRHILKHDGIRSRRADTIQSIHFAEKQETFTIPEPSPEELPEFFDDEERDRALAAAKELAAAALTEDSDDQKDAAPASCFVCCSAPTETTASDADDGGEEVELTEEVVETKSAKQLNSIIERRLSKQLSRGPSIAREESFRVDKGIVSFCTFLTAKSASKLCTDISRPVPLVNYLPPSPFFTFDGKLGIDCMAFKLDFTDKLGNIVPPFFLSDGEKLDERAKKIMKLGTSYGAQIDMFGEEDIDFITKEAEPSAAHKDLLSC